MSEVGNTPISPNEVVDAIEVRARQLAGGIHSRGAIPARFWKRAIAEALFTRHERTLDPEWAEAMLKRWGRA